MVKNIQKILIMELWGIGDVVMMSTILKPLRAAYPDAQITLLCQEHGQELLKENKEISSFITFKFPWTAFTGKYRLWSWNWQGIFSTIAKLRQERFDLIIDGRGDIRDDFLAFLIGPTRYLAAPHKRTMHRVDCWASLLKRLGLAVDALRPSITVSSQERSAAQSFISSHFPVRPGKLIGIHPGAAQPVRRWPLGRFKELVERLVKVDDIGIILFSDDEGLGGQLGQGLNLPVFKGNIRELTALIALMDIFVCNDTGVMHIASGVDVSVIALFGPGDPHIIGPRGVADILIKDCKHRPCFDKCGKKTSDCLLKITVDDVWGVVSRRLG